MRNERLRSTVRSAVAILSAACFLTVGFGSVSRAIAADTFETWPKKTTEPGVTENRGTDNGAVMAGDAAGGNVEKGVSSGTVGWIALGAAAVIGVAVAAGGGGSTSKHP
jgi:hypothetical protein